ncbi:DNA gyrase/topoisomerase IV subunit A [Halosquirtibacter xylanolyticus]|uniref:DNA gyrase/topoisomerase IV subunit A n=1 Tax=Halosquirtibacter xylanolyticus TaxID=3374599 RepID=UPI0037487777|nr:DNA gyrase/topoisomerase IV subunit A [Prolixibacteraceae bacterium]
MMDPKEFDTPQDENRDNENIDGVNDKLYHAKYISGMYKDWFLDYASYVILERAVPYVNDGLKPVQRRILHAMKGMDDGRYNKVANVIGQTMMYHPHGDASIGDALVQLGQKNLLVDTQGNWGNILTGDSAAAPRYIEARLSKFALEVVFNPKTTDWQLSYDGRNKEPLTLPVKYPLLLAQGVEGIAVGLASKILPHNFIELIDASILYLQKRDFDLYPDFPTGGYIDVSKYNNGLRGGAVRVRANIEKRDSKTLVVNQIPYGRTTSSVIDSIIKANDKGKIKVKKIDDNTAANVEILVHLGPGVSSDQMIDALYAFTDCEISISPNSCIIDQDKPVFLDVKTILRRSTENTLALLQKELEIRKSELESQWHYSSLERLFIEERMYKDKEFEEAKSVDEVVAHIDQRFDPWKESLKKEILREDIIKLLEIKMARILKFNIQKATDFILSIEEEIAKIDKQLGQMVKYTIDYFRKIKKKYGKDKERKTEIRSFENIEATKVVVANEKLYVDRKEGFIGTSLKKEEYLFECSDIDDVIIFRKDGSYFVTKVSEKAFIGKNVIHIAVFKKNDKRTIYNTVYREGKQGTTYMKRFFVTGVTRDREYNLMGDKAGSRLYWFSANPNGEAEKLKVTLKPKLRLKRLIFEVDLGVLAIKGRTSKGNTVTKNEVLKITLKEKGASTLGGRRIFFDKDIFRLNTEERGAFLGEFSGNDKIVSISGMGDCTVHSYDLSNHFSSDIKRIQKLDSDRVFVVVYWDADQKFYYIKRFQIDPTQKDTISFIGDNPKNKMMLVSDNGEAIVKIHFGARNENRLAEEVITSDFIGVKSIKAKGKRLTTFDVAHLELVEPEVIEEVEDIEDETTSDDDDNQMTLF